jgi:hypothetical protein
VDKEGRSSQNKNPAGLDLVVPLFVCSNVFQFLAGPPPKPDESPSKKPPTGETIQPNADAAKNARTKFGFGSAGLGHVK